MQDMIATPGQALDSRWARQVGIRAIEICDMIAAG